MESAACAVPGLCAHGWGSRGLGGEYLISWSGFARCELRLISGCAGCSCP